MKKWKIASLILLCISLFIWVFSSTRIKLLNESNNNLKTQVEDLKHKNIKLSRNINDLNDNFKKNETDLVVKKDKDNTTNNTKLNQQFAEIADKFVKLYPEYNIKTLDDKKKNLNDIATKNVADSIVPDDLIQQSSNQQTNQKGEVYSSDPSFVSKYKNSELYFNCVNAETVKYFAQINYETSSSSGNTKNTVYILFTVSNKGGSLKVTDYEIKYLK